MTDDEREERQLRMDQMTINIEKMRFDMAQLQKWETRKFVVSLLLATAASVGAGVGIGNLIWAHNPPPAPAPIIIQMPAPPTR